MITQTKTIRYHWFELLFFVVYTIFFASIICCWRAVSSITIAVLLLTGFLKNKLETGKWVNKKISNPLLISCVLFFVLQALALLYATNLQDGLNSLRTKAGLVFIPLVVCCCNYISIPVRQRLMFCYIVLLTAALLYCLLLATAAYTAGTSDGRIFFYHQLVSPFEQHAVQFSILVFVALLYLLEMAANRSLFVGTLVHTTLVVFFTTCILLLSSKLVITFTFCTLLYYGIRIAKMGGHRRTIVFSLMLVGLLSTGMISATSNRISHRFNEILSGNILIVEQPRFNAGMYFNGLQFRLLEWRFVAAILSEERSWLTGVGDNAQSLLDQKYIATGMYTGGANTADKGYLSYNTHNQFLQSLLQCGIPGLLSFIAIGCALVWMASVRRQAAFTLMVCLLIAYALNESVFETQYGLTLFILLPLFGFYGTRTGHAPAAIIQRKALVKRVIHS